MKRIILLISFLSVTAFSYDGGHEGHGGDPDALEIASISVQISRWMNESVDYQGKHKKVLWSFEADSLLESLNRDDIPARVKRTAKLCKDKFGVSKPLCCRPDKTIEFHGPSWNSFSDRKKVEAVAMEMACLTGERRNRYSEAEEVFGELYQAIISWRKPPNVSFPRKHFFMDGERTENFSELPMPMSGKWVAEKPEDTYYESIEIDSDYRTYKVIRLSQVGREGTEIPYPTVCRVEYKGHLEDIFRPSSERIFYYHSRGSLSPNISFSMKRETLRAKLLPHAENSANCLDYIKLVNSDPYEGSATWAELYIEDKNTFRDPDGPKYIRER